MGLPVSVVRGYRAPGKRWTPADRSLLVALQAYEDDVCGGCGQPRTYAMDEDSEGRYAAHTARCNGCAARQRADTEAKPPPGQYRFVVPDEGVTYAMHHPIHVKPVNT